VTTVVPYDTYGMYQIERTKTLAEIRYADQLASAISSLLYGLTQPVRAARRPSLAVALRQPRPA